MEEEIQPDEIEIPVGRAVLQGDLGIPAAATGIVVFAHGSGSSRFSPRNRWMAQQLNAAGLATLLFDLLTAEEQVIDEQTRELRFDIGLLSDRLAEVVDWASGQAITRGLALGLFGASTGAAAALNAAADRPQVVRAVVSRGGRPDLALDNLPRLQAPTLLIVGGLDHAVIEMNREAAARLHGECRLEIVPGATHLFEEPGKLEAVAGLARDWFGRHLGAHRA
ncbi:dienelactone hydrolase family protein [Thiohalobacter thiocyanaticus]|uniref:Alpha/beta hydrolase n=1 Tax=Thiohalobacter thiocyanaticus TaxID=585455 RepID=A0A426QMK8_9GAMM|nr:alpha/beta family hydrolase [Thiohalobacter thiocyanaticus]RRQ22992.1 alpha/beta hydrolase [Thiohalobacter thiocyanaticus]